MLLDKNHLFLFEINEKKKKINNADAQCNLTVIAIPTDSFFCGLTAELEYRRKEEKLITVSTCRLRLITGSFP